ncbi:ABCAD protein, partial [Edolisoma coerulescens]|nr:ABCAD protein [Edolisoma coerulescens]
MEEIKELAKEFIDTTEKAMALEKLWEENSRLSGTCLLFFFFSVNGSVACNFYFFFLIKMDLNEAEKIISRAENLYKQPYFWNLLHSLPHLELNSFYTEDELATITHFLKVIQNTLASLKDLAMMPLGQSFYEVVKMALNLTAASVQDKSFEGFQYNLSFGDVLGNLLAVKAELESRFGFDGPHVEKLLSYTAQLTEV